jgi:CheY-like chemotaxis protein
MIRLCNPFKGDNILGVHVLVIDDDLMIRKLFSLFLEKKGYQVTSVASAEEGLQVLNNNQVDTITCDVVMPGISGLDLLKIVKANDQLKRIPFIVLSGTGSHDELTQIVNLGASAVLEKPCTPPDLEKTIRRSLGS